MTWCESYWLQRLFDAFELPRRTETNIHIGPVCCYELNGSVDDQVPLKGQFHLDGELLTAGSIQNRCCTRRRDGKYGNSQRKINRCQINNKPIEVLDDADIKIYVDEYKYKPNRQLQSEPEHPQPQLVENASPLIRPQAKSKRIKMGKSSHQLQSEPDHSQPQHVENTVNHPTEFEPNHELQSELDHPQPELMEKARNLPTEFKPIVPIAKLEDLHNNIVLVDRNFNQTQKEFDMLNCGQLEVLVTPLENEPSIFAAKVQVGEFVLAETKATDRRGAKVAVQRHFMEHLGNWCYRIIRQKKSALIAKASEHRPKVNDYKDNQIDDTNLGYKMLLKHGWSGGALGPNEDGITEPIACQKGFQGFDQDRAKQLVSRKRDSNFDLEHYRKIIKEFRSNGVEHDLIFSAEFSKEERAQFHKIAEGLGLKSRSFGSKTQERQLLLHGKKLSMHEILQRVIIQKDALIGEMYKVQLPKRKFE